MTEHDFPDTEALARYRSGLLDGDVEAKRQVEDKLAKNPAMAREWEGLRAITAHLDEAGGRELGVANELRRRRREALGGRPRRELRFGLRSLAASALASVVIGLTIGLLLGRTMAISELLAAEQEEAREVAGNLDFYFWLEQQQAGGDGAPPRAGT